MVANLSYFYANPHILRCSFILNIIFSTFCFEPTRFIAKQIRSLNILIRLSQALQWLDAFRTNKTLNKRLYLIYYWTKFNKFLKLPSKMVANITCLKKIAKLYNVLLLNTQNRSCKTNKIVVITFNLLYEK